MGNLMRRHDWTATSLGAPGYWSQSLRTMLSVILHTKSPMLLMWGPDLIQFYNDAFRPSLGITGKHPGALGMKAVDCWPEIWTTIGPLFDQVMAGGEPIWQENQLIPIYRNGRLDDVYWTYSYSPVNDESGQTGGVLVVCQETTVAVNALQQLARKEQEIRQLFENAPVAIATFRGPQFVVEFANPTICRLWGRSAEQVLNKPLFEALPEAAGQGVEELLSGVLQTGEPFVGNELPTPIDRNGRREMVYWNFVYAPLFEVGQIVGITVVATDVSEQVAARQAVERSEQTQRQLADELEERVQQRTRQWVETNARLEQSNRELRQTADYLKSVLNGVSASIVVMEVVRDADGETVDFSVSAFNKPALDFTGQSSDDIVSRTLLEAHPILQTNGLFDRYVRVLTTGEPAYEERHLDRPTPGYYAFFITRQIDANGVVVMTLDITDRKNAETQVNQTAESLQAVLDSSPASIGLLTARYNQAGEVIDFILSACNQQFAELANQPSSDLIGASVAQVAGILWQADTFENVLHVLTTQESFYEERCETHNGTDRYIGISLNKHDDGVVITGLDITDLKQAEQQRVSWLQELKRSDDMVQTLDGMRAHIQQRGEFLRATSHDLRGSFGVIEGAATMLNLMDTEEDRASVLDMLQRNLRQVTQMLTQLLDYSRLEAGQEGVEPSRFDVAEVLRDMVAGLQLMATEQNLTLRGVGPDTLPVEGDLMKFRRIKQNLVLNALKYTQTGGVIVTWEPDEKSSYWRLSVQDTGPGLPPAIVNMLQQMPPVHATQTQPKANATGPGSGGEGIGLFIVRRLSDLLGGHLTVETGADSGTRITIRFPRRYPETQTIE